MTTRVKNLLSAFAVLLFMVLAVASSGIGKMHFSKETGQIPPDFGTTNDTLIVLSHPDNWGYDHYLRKNFRDYYFGNYKIIRVKELKNYPAEKYRYVFDDNLNFTTTTTATSTPITGGGHVINGPSNTTYSSNTYASSSSFGIQDRKTNKNYSTGSTAFYSKLMKAYLKALEDVRQK